ncbi:MAG: TetR/AcrR family transcriptional regulator [Anaerolineae bacterium]|nr:TetR/AcrR family transcriptional regulator [Anaerolineae bacterium]
MKNVKQHPSHRQRQALATRQVILEAARVLFLEQGYGTTTIESISDKAGVAVSTVYSIYKNKRGILAAIRETWHQESGQREIYQLALSESDLRRRMEPFAKATRRQWEASASMMSIYHSAAAVDPEAAATSLNVGFIFASYLFPVSIPSTRFDPQLKMPPSSKTTLQPYRPPSPAG